MADNVLGSLFQSIADAIRNKTGKGGTIIPANFANEINSIVVGAGGAGGGTETGLGDLKIARGSFNSGTGYRKTITHGLGKMPDLVMVYYGNADWTYGDVQFSKMERFFAVGIHSSLQAVANFKGCTHSFGIGTVQAEYYMDEGGAVSNSFIYCTDEDTFSWGWANDGSNTNGNGLMVANKTYHWLAISGMGGSIGVVDDRIKYVTFMNGTTELFRYPIMVGDDCPNPVTQEHITTPTKASTAQYEYTHNGWSLTDGGDADDTALSNVTEDRKVYAAYESTVREYNVTYLDTDGTVLKTDQLPYGTNPNDAYTPTKEGASFTKWTPETVVTGDMTYTAGWLEKVTFANSSWADIARVCEAGQAQDTFALKDTRTININGTDVEFFIAGFNHDDLDDGTGKASITVISKTVIPNSEVSTGVSGGVFYSNGAIEAAARNLFNTLDTDLQSVIKPVKKEIDTYSNVAVSDAGTQMRTSTVWCLSAQEAGKNISSTYASHIKTLGTKYAGVGSSGYNLPVGDKGWWVRNRCFKNTSKTELMYYNGNYIVPESSSTSTHKLIVGFCI